MRWLLRCVLLLVLLTSVLLRPGVAAELMGDPDELWNPDPPESRFESMAEERFQMECDYLGIGGERKALVRKLFESLMKARESVARSRDTGALPRIEAIAKFNRLDLDYYLELKNQVKGRRNTARLDRMIQKAGARNGDVSNALKIDKMAHTPGQ